MPGAGPRAASAREGLSSRRISSAIRRAPVRYDGVPGTLATAGRSSAALASRATVHPLRTLVGDGVVGLAVHIAARVMAEAGPGEVLVSRTARDLVAGSGISFADRGARLLKGVPGEWQLYAADG